jgi:hypothetical protein
VISPTTSSPLADNDEVVSCLYSFADQGDRQYQSTEFYKAEKQVINRFEMLSGDTKADISPDPQIFPQKISEHLNNFDHWFCGQYPSPLQNGKSLT